MPPTLIEQRIMQQIYRIPSITGYNRLEAAPRLADFDQSLRAEIRDPLWMLTRQWQFGEFQGEDAASPVSAMILGEHTPVDRISQGGNPATDYDESIPLETAVEAERLGDSLYLAVQIARYFIRLMRAKSVDTTILTRLSAEYSLGYAIDPNDADGLLLAAAVRPTMFDGCALLRAINTPSGTGNQFTAWLTAQGIVGPTAASLTGLAGNLTAWYTRNYSQPPGGAANKSWIGSSLDYSFELGSPEEGKDEQTVLTASQFYGGHLDWYDFDIDNQARIPLSKQSTAAPAVQENLVSFIPSPVAFKGMPNPRFWTMEDSQTDFGKIDTSPTGLLHLLLAEFGLIYGNDWFMLPYPLKINTICQIKGLVVTDTFGENVLINGAGAGAGNSWQRWAMFHQADTSSQAIPNQLFYLAPAVTRSLENDPLEQVNFLRDEVADLVWAVEDTVPSQSGKGVSGKQIALKTTPPPDFVPAGSASIRYVLGTAVPDNWIPFIPVHMEGSDTEIQFQRARMPGNKPPLGEILTEIPAPYYVREEEIPRAGVILTRTFRRARWLNGKTFLWIGRTRDSGRGEGWSNLKFDQITNITPAPAAAPVPPVLPPGTNSSLPVNVS
jgi:hypothetical protein